jgi:HCOMODA/2-hydroxy-3-carboxy-muconic semialdehyde decarboxylase
LGSGEGERGGWNVGSDEALKTDIVTACQILEREGILDELGHFSARVPGQDRVWMNGKISPGRVTPEDLILLDLEGNKLAGRLPPAKEIPLHLAVYRRRPDVTALAHTHSPTVVALSISGRTLRAVDNLGATTFGAEAPIFGELGLVDNFEMGLRMADALGPAPVLVLKGHGNIVVGHSIPEACVGAIWTEKAARLQYQASLLGTPEYFPADEVAVVRKQVVEGKAFERAWDYYVWRLGR